jgi:hypothetical protein
MKTRIFEIEVDQVVNRKVVDLPSLCNFHEGHMGFFWAPMNSNPGIDLSFSPI